jgi:hypothetical protein
MGISSNATITNIKQQIIKLTPMKKIFFSLLVCVACMSTSYAQWNTSGNNIYNSNSGFVGIGTSTPTFPLTLTTTVTAGDAMRITNSSTGNAVIEHYTEDGSATYSGQVYGSWNGLTSPSVWQSSKQIVITPVLNSPQTGLNLLTNGNVGIGTTTPNNKLEIDPNGAGGLFIGNSNASSGGYTSLFLGLSSYTSGYANIQCISASGSTYGNIVLNQSGGSVAIGTSNPAGYLLAVNGSAIFTKAVVKLNANWPDFVFDSSYQSPSLSDIAAYLRKNKHLPGIPSAGQIEQDGLDLGAMEKLHMQKIEELTLYAIRADTHSKEQDTILLRQQTLLVQQQALLEQMQAQLKVQQQEIEQLKAQMNHNSQ